jgi:type IV pilus assembly protein PilY1
VSDVPRTTSHWRTILIGGMRYGGHARTRRTHHILLKHLFTNLGYSSHLVDVTNQNNPTLLWEYSNPELGFATPGPAVVRINA